jgi:hypothetical protein
MTPCFPAIVMLMVIFQSRPRVEGEDTTRTPQRLRMSGAKALADLLDLPGEEILPAEAEYLETQGEHLFDLNSASRETILRIPGVTLQEADAFIRYRRSVRVLHDLAEIAAVEGCGPEFLHKVQAYVAPPGSQWPLLALSIRVQAAGDSSLPFGQVCRATCDPSPWLSAGIRVARAPAEPLSQAALSGYALLRTGLLNSEVVVGDFVVESGQGLTLWGPGNYHSGLVRTPRSSPRGVRPLLAADGTQSMRGVALNASGLVGNLLIRGSVFCSSVSLRGNFIGDSVARSFSSEGALSLVSDGKSRVRERVMGLGLHLLVGGTIEAGCTGVMLSYNAPLSQEWIARVGSGSIVALTLDGQIRIGPAVLSAEYAFAPSGNGCTVRGQWELFGGMTVSALFRHYPRGIMTRFSSRPGFRTGGGFEEGCLLACRMPVAAGLTLDGVIDQYVVNLGRDDSPPRGKGRDMIFSLNAEFPRFFSCQIQIRTRLREECVLLPDLGGRLQQQVAEKTQSWFRYTMEIPLRHGFHVRSRLDVTGLSTSAADKRPIGESLALDCLWESSGVVSAVVRLLAFGTDSYDARLYDFQGGIPGALAITPLYGAGRKWSAILTLRPFAGASLSCRYAVLSREEGREGAEWRPRLSRSEVTVQMDVRL